MSPESEQNEKSVIVVDCQDCTEIDVVTMLDHARDSRQHYAVLDAHEIMVDEHHEETGHTVDFNRFGGSPGEMLDVARTWARKVDGVEDDAFAEELVV